MAGQTGNTILLQVDTTGEGNWVDIGLQRGLDDDRQSTLINMSDKTSKHDKVEYGRFSSTVTLSTLWPIPGSETGLAALKNAHQNGTKMQVRLTELDNPTKEARVVVNQITKAGPDNAEATWSITMTVDDGWTQL